jgi:pyruvate,water dikinase
MAPIATHEAVLDAAAAGRAGADRVGGKATGLVRLAQAGVRAPWWIVLPTEAFEAHVARAWLTGDESGRLTRERVDEAGTWLAQAVACVPLDPELAAVVKAAVGARAPLAVRSSVVGEDSAACSYAGLFDSYLFVDDVAAAIVRCWASAFSPRALAYRLERGLALEPPVMGVIVQEAVLGEVSGVLFTSNPASGRRDEAMVSACWGLGEGLVSGRCDADEFVYSHAGRERSATVATKDVQIVPAPGGGTREAPVNAERRDVRCLSTRDASRLVKAGLEIAAGVPQDIEWTLVDGEFVFLQSRPITTLPAAPLGHNRIVWDNSNIQESFNGVTTPLTFSVALQSYSSIYAQTLRVLGVRGEAGAARNLLGLVDGRVYYNIDNWYRLLLALPGFDRNKADMEQMMGLEDPVDFVEGVALSRREKLRRLPGMLKVMARLAWSFRRLDASVENFMRRFDERMRSFDRDRLATASYGELIELAGRVQTEIVDRWIVPIINDTYVMTSAGRLRKLVGEELASGLMAGERAVASTQPTRRLVELAAEIRADGELLRALVDGTEAEALERLRSRLGGFIDEFGDRCMGEMKLETISLRQDATFVVRILRNFVAQPDLDTGALDARELERRAALERHAAERLGPRRRRRLRRRLEAVHRGVAARERLRLARTRFVGLFRDIYCAAGERLHEAGLLDDPRDVFYLTVDELVAVHEGTAVTADLAGLARLRKAEYAAYERRQPPHHFETIGSPYHGERLVPRRPPLSGDAGSLRGVGCSPGVVEGDLHVVMRPDDDLAVNGKILTALRTDPGWAPLFPSAAGLLIERGSTLSHSAVLAREFGLPCVVGVPGLLQRIRHGERVRLDGATGVVERLEAT